MKQALYVSVLYITFLPIFALAQAPPAPARSPAREPWMSLPPASTGINVGQKIPPFQLRDQFGRLQDFNSLRGPKGAAIIFNRSADW